MRSTQKRPIIRTKMDDSERTLRGEQTRRIAKYRTNEQLAASKKKFCFDCMYDSTCGPSNGIQWRTKQNRKYLSHLPYSSNEKILIYFSTRFSLIFFPNKTTKQDRTNFWIHKPQNSQNEEKRNDRMHMHKWVESELCWFVAFKPKSSAEFSLGFLPSRFIIFDMSSM